MGVRHLESFVNEVPIGSTIRIARGRCPTGADQDAQGVSKIVVDGSALKCHLYKVVRDASPGAMCCGGGLLEFASITRLYLTALCEAVEEVVIVLDGATPDVSQPSTAQTATPFRPSFP